MGIFMKVSLKIEKRKEKDLKDTQMEMFMKVSLKMIKKMVKEVINLQMEIFIKAILKMGKQQKFNFIYASWAYYNGNIIRQK